MANRLIHERSAYLRQHAHNPVDWHPWGEEALSRARAEDKPILLSIGYSACHWCHVMERESFDDPAVAARMNELFVNVKVDREERPDLDQIYQAVVQIMRRSGGWPLTVFLTPDRRPFFGGTYFPPVPRHGMPSFSMVLAAVAEAWRDRRADVERTSADLVTAIGQLTSVQTVRGALGPGAIGEAASALARRFDPVHGGFGDRPKFPSTMSLDVMLRAWRRGDGAQLARVERTLDAMRAGGVYDQLGGGFHRYSTDARWLVPHFEKMLYDNALLARLYLDGWRATGDAGYASTVAEILGYLEREMMDPSGLFYSTQDADSEGEEGRFFVWTPAQIAEVIGEDAAIVCDFFGVSEQGNFEGTGASVLHLARALSSLTERYGKTQEELQSRLERARERLFAAREARPKPFRDPKILATWNGLAIAAFADAGAALGEPRWVERASRALERLRELAWREPVLHRVVQDGEAAVPGFLEDYADLALGALAVRRATQDPGALSFARALADAALERFWDGEAFYFAASAPDLVVRPRDPYDNAVPSGTSQIVHALLRLETLTGEARYLEVAERVLERLGGAAIEHPAGFANLASAVDRYVRGAVEVVVVSEPGDAGGEALEREALCAYEPDLELVRLRPGEAHRALGGVPARLHDGRATAYVCRERACSAPVTEPEALAGSIRSVPEAGGPDPS